MRFATAHGLGEIKGAVISLPGKSLEPAPNEESEAFGKVISAKKFVALDMTRAELFELRNLLDKAIARHHGVGDAKLLNRRNCHRLAQE
jgi:hypothetical protein